MSKGKILITDSVHPLLIEGLQHLGYVCDYLPAIKTDEVFSCISNYIGLIINSKIKVDQKMFVQAHALKFVGRLGSGMEIVDLDFAREKGVAILRSPEGNRNAVAEHAVGMLLALNNKLLLADREVRSFKWDREGNRGVELEGKTIGIVGFGNTGRALAEKFAGWNVQVLAYDKYKEGFCNDLPHVKETTMEEICAKTDVLSLHIPLTTETKHLVRNGFLEKFNKQIVLVNTSRGPILDTEYVIKMLKSGKLNGACLDVYENEKIHTYTEKERVMYEDLFQLENTILSPHVAGWTHESKQKLAETLLAKIKSVLEVDLYNKN